jgi:hypothetical protein
MKGLEKVLLAAHLQFPEEEEVPLNLETSGTLYKFCPLETTSIFVKQSGSSDSTSHKQVSVGANKCTVLNSME